MNLPTQKAILFIDDWNNSDNASVNINYGSDDIANRVLPDGEFTDGKDTTISTVVINELSSIEMDSLSGTQLDGTNWASAADNFATVIFRPPYAETTIIGENSSGTTDLRSFTAKFLLTTENSERTIEFNRVTTTPQINLN